MTCGRSVAGVDQGFQVRGGALKKIAANGVRHEHFWGISCEKSRFYAKIFFFPIAEGGAKIFGVFRVKNHDFMPKKNHIFSNFRGGEGRVRPLLDPPLHFSPHLSSFLNFFARISILY